MAAELRVAVVPGWSAMRSGSAARAAAEGRIISAGAMRTRTRNLALRSLPAARLEEEPAAGAHGGDAERGVDPARSERGSCGAAGQVGGQSEQGDARGDARGIDDERGDGRRRSAHE